jgi:hypothetical protein
VANPEEPVRIMLKRLAILAVVLTVAVSMSCQPNKATDQKQEHAEATNSAITAANGINKQNRSTANETKSNSNPPKWYAAIKRPEWWLVIIAALTGIVVGWQAWETRKAAEASRDSIALILRKERPRITVEDPPHGLIIDMREMIFMDPILIDISNRGFTQALNVRASGGVIMVESATSPQLKTVRHVAVPAIIEANGDPVTIALHYAEGFPVTGPADVPEVFYTHVLGRITYEDYMGARYETTFRYRLTMFKEGVWARAEGNLGWEPYGPARDNQAT